MRKDVQKIETDIKNAVLEVLTKEEQLLLCEMGYNRNVFKLHIRSQALHLYQTLINVVVLEEIFPEMVRHWCKEIYVSTSFIIEDETSQSFDRAPLVKSELMEPQMGVDFEDYKLDSFEKAMNIEIKKAETEKRERMKTERMKEARIIRQHVMPILNDFFSNPNIKIRLQTFYQDLFMAVKHKDTDELKASINKFANIND